jgi:hypothetical protein
VKKKLPFNDKKLVDYKTILYRTFYSIGMENILEFLIMGFKEDISDVEIDISASKKEGFSDPAYYKWFKWCITKHQEKIKLIKRIREIDQELINKDYYR